MATLLRSRISDRSNSARPHRRVVGGRGAPGCAAGDRRPWGAQAVRRSRGDEPAACRWDPAGLRVQGLRRPGGAAGPGRLAGGPDAAGQRTARCAVRPGHRAPARGEGAAARPDSAGQARCLGPRPGSHPAVGGPRRRPRRRATGQARGDTRHVHGVGAGCARRRVARAGGRSARLPVSGSGGRRRPVGLWPPQSP